MILLFPTLIALLVVDANGPVVPWAAWVVVGVWGLLGWLAALNETGSKG